MSLILFRSLPAIWAEGLAPRWRSGFGWSGLIAVLSLASSAAFAQGNPASRLPPCPTETTSGWTNCFGIRTFQSGSRYEGEFRADAYHGRGTFTFANGQKYVGEYRDGKRTGYGTYTFPSGEKYVGSFLDGKYHGLGTLTFANGAIHYGEWRDDKRHGKGTYVTPDGRRFVGEYVEGKRSGLGVQYDRQGAILQSGRWEDGQLAQSQSVDTVAYPFVMAGSPPAAVADAGRADRERRAAETQAQTERQRRQELERELAEERRKRMEAERRGGSEPAGSTGTGFAIAPGFLITNHHVVEDCPRPEILSLDGRRVGAIVDTDDLVDLALIRVTGLSGSIAALRRPGSVRLGEPAYAFGFPLSGVLTEDGNFTNGVVSGLKGLRNSANEFQITTPLQPGNSGGAVIDSAGNVIGVVVSKLNAAAVAKLTGDIPQNVNFAISLQALVDFLGKNRVPFRNAERSAAMETAQIAELTRSFTHRIVCPENTARAPQRATPAPQASAPPAAPAAPSAALDTTVQLKNQSRESIFSIHVSPVASDKWGPDLLGRDVLLPGKEFTLQPPVSQGCRYDVMVEYESGKKQERRDQNFCELVEIDFDGRVR